MKATDTSNPKSPRRLLGDVTSPGTARHSKVLSNTSLELGQKGQPNRGNAYTISGQYLRLKGAPYFGGCLHYNVCRLLTKGFNLIVGIGRQFGRATFQGGIRFAERFANCLVAGLDVLSIDVNSWCLLYRIVDFEVFAQGRSWGFGRRLADSHLRIA